MNGEPQESNFGIQECPIPTSESLAAGDVLVKNLFLSVDPALVNFGFHFSLRAVYIYFQTRANKSTTILITTMIVSSWNIVEISVMLRETALKFIFLYINFITELVKFKSLQIMKILDHYDSKLLINI